MDVIFTKYHGPTDSKGSRISASIPHRKVRVIVPLNHSLDIVERHREAAAAVVSKLGWTDGALPLAGETPDGKGFLFVHGDA